jgi:hypothetical protein
MSIIQRVSQLTCLELLGTSEWDSIKFTRNFTQGWSRLTALQNLTLQHCRVAPEAVADFTQLRSLRLRYVTYVEEGNLEGLLNAVSVLTLLTELTMSTWELGQGEPPAAAAFTALTASTNLCCLELDLDYDSSEPEFESESEPESESDPPPGVDLFRSGAVYPHLHRIELGCGLNGNMPLSKQQLCQDAASHTDCQRFKLCPSPTPDTLRPLLQLPALTKLQITGFGPSAAVVATTVHIVAQLTGLRRLWLAGLPDAADPNNLQLTTLTALEHLTLLGLERPSLREGHSWQLYNKVSPSSHWSKNC